MRSYSASRDADDINPYIALADIAISIILVVVFFFALDRLGMVNFKYKKDMQDFNLAVQKQLPLAVRPRWEHGRRDPPGVQRWVFDGRSIFLPASPANPNAAPQLTPDGQRVFTDFAKLLREYGSTWQRIRVEGHTKPPQQYAADDWDLSARRAAAVVKQLESGGHIKPWYFAVAGRAGQNPLHAVFVCCYPGTPAAASVENILQSHGVTFTEKDLHQDLSKDPAVKDALSQMTHDGRPYYVEIDDDGGTTVFPARDDPRDDARLTRLIQQFGQNERVEVLIEYTSKGSGSASQASN